MIRKILIATLSLCLPALAPAQDATLTPKEMISITPMLSSYLELPSDAVSSLSLKLNQMVSQNGFGATSGQFVLTANAVTLDKQVTATAPANYIVELEVSFFIVNVAEQVVIDEMSYTVKGVANHENKAVIQAINQIKPKSPQAREFMDNARTKIIEYYNTRTPALITKAQTLASQNEYEEALYVLASVPESVSQYPMVAEQMSAIYLKMIDRDATAAIMEARGFMAVRDYEGALNALNGVDPSSSKSPEAFAIINQIKNSVDASERRALEDKWRVYEDRKEAAQRAEDNAVMLRKQQLSVIQQVGVEQAKSGGSLSNSLNRWFLGKFR